MYIEKLSRRNFIKWTSVISASSMLPLSSSLLAKSRQKTPENAVINLRILSTTDIHANMMAYDYYVDKPSLKLGFARTASLIKQARKENTNSILVDNGDLIQGAPLATCVYKKGLRMGEIHPVIAAMNEMGYDVATLGNHEFDYGMFFLNQTLSGAQFPYIVSNTYDAYTDKPYFKQYIIKTFPVKTEQGERTSIRVGFVGFVTPQITIWDKKYLNGKIITKDIIDTANTIIPEMKIAGADLIIALSHSGLSAKGNVTLIENAAYYLSQIRGIDGIVTGHQHMRYPGKDFAALPNTNLTQGTINNLPVVMAGCYGSYLGVMDLKVTYRDNKWRLLNACTETRSIYDNQSKTELAVVDKNIASIFAPWHQKTRDVVGRRIGQTATEICSYLSMLQNSAALQLINEAQIYYIKNYLKSSPEYTDLPLISSAASYKTGSQLTDPDNYVRIGKGNLLFRNAVELYPFGNSVSLLKITGRELKEWLECSVSIFNQIHDISTPQNLINEEKFKNFNFDVFYNIEYDVDLSTPPRYNAEYQLTEPDSERIVNLRYQGNRVSDGTVFLVASNSHRAHEGIFPGTGDNKILYASTDETRVVIADYIEFQTSTTGTLNIKVQDNWSFVPVHSTQKLDIRYYTAATDDARTFIEKQTKYNIHYTGITASGFAIYSISSFQKKPLR